MKNQIVRLVSCLAALSILIAPSAMADTTVLGMGNPVEDVANVQSAVDAGGVVTLQGEFDFGPSGQVIIGNSVEIVGEDAVINNGEDTFEVVTLAEINSTVAIRDITLVNPKRHGILVSICEDFLAERVTISGMTSGETGVGPRKRGIWADAIYQGFPLTPNTYIKKFHVLDCDVDLGDYSNNLEGGNGISAFGVGYPGDDVDILIKGNSVRNCSRYGILILSIAGEALVEDNVIITGNKAYNPIGGAYPIGILAAQNQVFFDPVYLPHYAQISIVNNSIESGPDAWAENTAIGVYADLTNGLIVKKNTIETHDGIADLILDLQGNSGFIIEKNKFEGDGQWLSLILSSATSGSILNNSFKNSNPLYGHIWCVDAVENLFVGNNINSTNEIITYAFLPDSSFNVVRGHTGDSAVDYGTENYLTGVTPMADAEGAGQQMSQAMHELHERLTNGDSLP